MYFGGTLQTNLQDIEKQALEQIGAAESADALESISTHFLGRKGLLTAFLRNIPSLPVDERPAAGKNGNLLKVKLEKAVRQAQAGLEADAAGGAEGIDITLPGRMVRKGALHPVTPGDRRNLWYFSSPGI